MRIKRRIALALSAVLLCASLLAPSVTAANDMPGNVIDQFEAKSFTDPDSGLTLPYRIYVPEQANKARQYSFLLFLHGAGERATDNRRHIAVNSNLLTRIVNDTDRDHACIIIAPQCPDNQQWVDTPWGNGSYSLDSVPQSKQLAAAMKLVDEVTGSYAVDEDRMYVAGISMGGYGTWDTILRYPDKFAAAIPVCGAGDPTKADRIKEMPIRAFHSSDDGTVPVSGTREMVAALRQLGSDINYKEYTNAGHGSWQPAFEEPDLVDWLFTQKQTQPASSMTEVRDPAAFIVPEGTGFDALELPAAVQVKLDSGEWIDASVTWSSEGYDGDVPGAYTITGDLAAENVLNPDGLQASVQVTVEPVKQPVIKGDLTGDSNVNVTDVMEACRVLARKSNDQAPTPEEMERGDVDQDGYFTITDVMQICKIISSNI